MPEPFEQITEALKKEGMSAEDTTLAAVEHQANIVATYYLALRGKSIKANHALELTSQWMGICSEADDEDE